MRNYIEKVTNLIPKLFKIDTGYAINIIDDPKDRKTHRLKNLIVFKGDLSDEDRELAKKADLALFTYDEII